MSRPPHPSRAPALADLRNGDSVAVVAERYGVKEGTVRSWKRTLPEAPARPAGKVIPLPGTERIAKGGRTGDPRVKAEKLKAYHEATSRARKASRAAALSPIDRATVRHIIRRLVNTQASGLWCSTCPPDALSRIGKDGPEANQLSPKDLLDMTRILHMNLDKLGPLLEVEGRLDETETEERGADYYETEEGRAQLAQELTALGPRLLSKVLASSPRLVEVFQAAIDHSQRITG